jgi:hypothetical protein
MEETRRIDLHQRLLGRYGARGEALYVLVAGFLAARPRASRRSS